MITLTAYTEPVPINPINEQPQLQAHEPDDNEEQSSFAEILAGLMRNTEISRIDQPVEITANETGIDALAGPELQNLGLHTEAPAIEANSNVPAEETVTEFADAGLMEDDQSLFLSDEQFLSDIESLFADEEAALSQEAAKKKLDKSAEELSAKTDSFQLRTPAETDAEALTAMQDAEKRLSEANAKKSRSENETRPLHSDSKEDTHEIAAGKKSAEENANLNNKPQEKSRLDEARSRSRKDKVTFEVRDLRTGNETNVNGANTRSYTVVETAASRAQNSAGNQEMTLELRLPDHNNATGNNMAQASWETSSGNALENMLARELHQNFNGDIVRHASMALKDGGEGTIRLALKPESLGNVKIHLEMSENKITGRIVVESQEALQAFRKELSALEQAFKDSGYADASLDLSLTADDRSAEGQDRDDSFSSQVAAERYDGSIEQDALTIDVFFGRKGLVNMLA